MNIWLMMSKFSLRTRFECSTVSKSLSNISERESTVLMRRRALKADGLLFLLPSKMLYRVCSKLFSLLKMGSKSNSLSINEKSSYALSLM